MTKFSVSTRLWFAVALSACNASESPPTSTEVEGTVGGVTLASATAFFAKSPGGVFGTTEVYVLISADPQGCADATSVVLDPGIPGSNGGQAYRSQVVVDGGSIPSIFLQFEEGQDAFDGDANTSFRTLRRDLHASLDPGCPPETPSSVSSSKCTTDVALQGSVSFYGDNSKLANGLFSLSFTDGTMAGTFHAAPCAALSVGSGCESTGGADLLALLGPLGLWLRGRVRWRRVAPSTC